MDEPKNPEMDNQASLAQGEMEFLLAEGKVSRDEFRKVADWWKRWYLKAGYKRLGRALVAMAKEAGNGNSQG